MLCSHNILLDRDGKGLIADFGGTSVVCIIIITQGVVLTTNIIHMSHTVFQLSVFLRFSQGVLLFNECNCKIAEIYVYIQYTLANPNRGVPFRFKTYLFRLLNLFG